MEHIIKSIQECVNTRNWHAAMALSLTVPDICGQIEYPAWRGPGFTGRRYPKWFDNWVKEHLFRNGIGGKENPMDGKDCYALRNAFLHTGAKEVRLPGDIGYKIIVPTSGCLNHMGTDGVEGDNIVLYVGTGPFCNAICSGVSNWVASITKDRPEAVEEIKALLTILEGEVTVSYTTQVGDFIVNNTTTSR